MCNFIETRKGSSGPDWLHYFSKRSVVILIGAIIVLPRCFSSSMSRLWLNSFASSCTLLLAIISVVFIFFSAREADGPVNPVRVTPAWWVAPGIILFSVSYQQVAITVQLLIFLSLISISDRIKILRKFFLCTIAYASERLVAGHTLY